MFKTKTQAEVSKPFNAKRKIYPNGEIHLKKYKFTAYGIEVGYEQNKSYNADIKKQKTLQFEQGRETYSSIVQDFYDRQAISNASVLARMEKDDIYTPVKALSIVYMPVDRNEPSKLEYNEERRRKKVLYNIAKTRDKIFDIACSNDFNYFITLTYNQEKCDRYSFQDCSKAVRKFMNNFSNEHKNDCPNFKYLLVHEQHKDGAYHYHGLIYLEDTDTLKLAEHQPKSCKYPVFNWGRWKYGFSTVTKIEDVEATRKYILKYINKNIDENYVKGQRHFYYSQNCAKPIIEKMHITDLDILSLYKEIYETDKSAGYQSTVSELKESIDMISDFRYGI